MNLIKKYHNFNTVRIAFCGDTLIHQSVISREENNGYTFAGLFDFVKDLFDDCDAVIVNLEGTFNGEPYIGKTVDGLPKFSIPDEFASALSSIGVTHASIANNHIYDYGKAGYDRTVQILKSANIESIAGQTDIMIDNKAFSFYAFTTHSNQDQPEGFDLMDKPKVVGKGFPVAMPHWGGQFNMQPNKEQIEIALDLKKLGFKLIVGSGPHVAHDVEMGKCVNAFSLGNFVSDHMRAGRLDGGIIVIADIGDNKVYKIEVHKIGLSSDNGELVMQVNGVQKYDNTII